jgi:hypothetical protein
MKYNNLTELFTAIADSIRGKTGGSDKIPAENFPEAIDGIQAGGSSSASPKDVNFYDYDGTLLHSYTVAEAQALSELPPLPEQEGLICQEWNYTLDEIKAHNRPLDIGATYITDDGKTRLYIKIAAEGRMDVPLYFSQTVANGVTIDWGDGSATETLSGTGNKNTVHTYASIGEYVISLDVVDGCTLGWGRGSSSYCVLGSTGVTGRVYCNMLQKVEVGNGVTSIDSYAFYYCYSLTSITIPNGVTSIGSNSFYSCYSLTNITIPNSVTNIGGSFNSCYSLASIIIPNSVTSIGSNSFSSCYSLTSITIPNGVTSIGKNKFENCYSLASVVIPNSVTSIGDFPFYSCYSLASITIPDSVTSIGSGAFQNCYCMKFCDFTSHTAVPTLSSTNLFSGAPSDLEIRVPAALYDEWIAATNWSTYADKIVAV